MAVGTGIERLGTQTQFKRSGMRKWIVALAIAVAAAGAGTGIFLTVNGTEASTGTPAVSSPEIPYVDPGVDARQDALKRFHEENASSPVADSDPQAPLKRYHLDSKG